jgi:hypothetical protein
MKPRAKALGCLEGRTDEVTSREVGGVDPTSLDRDVGTRFEVVF